jgi:hypothetical protein
MLIILLLHGAPGKLAVPPRPQVLSCPIEVLRDSDLTKSGHFTQIPSGKADQIFTTADKT